MTPIQIMLIGVLLIIMAYALVQDVTNRIVKIAMVFFAVIGIGFVAVPSLSTAAANVLGVGRGADLVLYLLSLSTLALFVGLYARTELLHHKITELVRRDAVLHARAPDIRKPDERGDQSDAIDGNSP